MQAYYALPEKHRDYEKKHGEYKTERGRNSPQEISKTTSMNFTNTKTMYETTHIGLASGCALCSNTIGIHKT